MDKYRFQTDSCNYSYMLASLLQIGSVHGGDVGEGGGIEDMEYILSLKNNIMD